MKKKLLGGKNMTDSYQIKSSRKGRQGKAIHLFLHCYYMLPIAKTGWKVQNRQENFLPWSLTKLWQPLPQGVVGTETLLRFKSNQRSLEKQSPLALRTHEHMLLLWEFLKLLIAGSAFWQSTTVCLAYFDSLTSASPTGLWARKDNELKDAAIWPSIAVLIQLY